MRSSRHRLAPAVPLLALLAVALLAAVALAGSPGVGSGTSDQGRSRTPSVTAAARARREAPRPPATPPTRSDTAAPYRLALPGYRFEFPRDHFDHPDFQTEWWYFTGNLRARDGRRFGFELTFFRQAVDRSQPASRSPWAVRDVYLAHFALSDLDGGSFAHEERVNRAGPGLAGVDRTAGAIWNGNWRVTMQDAPGSPSGPGGGLVTQSLAATAASFAVRLSLASTKPPVVNGVNGVSQKAAGPGQASHYVSMTRLRATGRVEVNGRAHDIVEGTAWMDHEFFTNQLGRDQRGWDWLSLHLDDHTELMVYRLRRDDGSVDPFSAGTVVAADGTSSHLQSADFSMVPTGPSWTSPVTGATYPIGWKVRVPSRGLDLDVRTPLPAQELAGTRGWTPAYWEGAVTTAGTRHGARVGGVGYLELTGYDKPVNLGQK